MLLTNNVVRINLEYLLLSLVIVKSHKVAQCDDKFAIATKREGHFLRCMETNFLISFNLKCIMI